MNKCHILKFILLDEFNDDIFLWLDLEHLENQAEEGCGFDVAAIHTTNGPQCHSLVNQ